MKMTIDEALIMALKIHNQDKRCGYISAIRTGLTLRKQLNLFDELGLTPEAQAEMMQDAKCGAVIPKEKRVCE